MIEIHNIDEGPRSSDANMIRLWIGGVVPPQQRASIVLSIYCFDKINQKLFFMISVMNPFLTISVLFVSLSVDKNQVLVDKSRIGKIILCVVLMMVQQSNFIIFDSTCS